MLPSSLVVALLCGGKSSRFGSNKALEPFDGSVMIKCVVRQLQQVSSNMILVTNTPEEYSFLNLPCLTDARPYAGPLAALVTVFEKTSYNQIVLVACDMPRLDYTLIEALVEHAPSSHACVIQDAHGPQYLLARYSRRLLKPLKEFTMQGGKSFKVFFQNHPSYLTLIDSKKNIPNINTRKDIKETHAL